MSELPSGTVTFLFSDIEGSTRLLEEFPEAQQAALLRHGALLRAAIEGHGGSVFETIGDGYYAVFARPSDAVAAGLRAQADLQAEPWGDVGPLKVRMALHSGGVERQGDRYYGAPLYRCARLLALGHGGQVLLSAATSQLVRGALPFDATLRGLGTHRLKDLAGPEDVFQLAHPALPADFPALRSIDTLPTNLPVQVTSFVGREHEMAELARLLGRTRILTLTGAGGVGKTRLALQTAAEALDRYPDGVWLVELAPLSDPSLVIHEVASSLGVREQHGRPLVDTLADHLRPRRALIVLDNCEHLVARCAELVHALVHACPQLQVLATSREALSIDGETDWRVPSLALPDAARLPPIERLARCEAVQLFVERAAAALPSFRLIEENARAVAQICQSLDGIPLAIELAAARIKVLSADQIASRLDNLFRLLTAGSRTALPRQQTLQATIDWSYDLLTDDERCLFARLSIFAGGWTLDAAEDVCAGDSLDVDQVFDALARLVDKSLVLAEVRGGEARYRLLEPVRQYATEKVRVSGEEVVLRFRHLDWFVRLAQQADELVRGPQLGVWVDRLEVEHDNLRAALDWSSTQEGGAEAELNLCSALTWFWWVCGYLPEGRGRLNRALTRTSPASAARVRALAGAAWLAHFHRDPTAALTSAGESLAIAQELGDKRGVAWALHVLGRIHYFEGDAATARDLAKESLANAREIEDQSLIAWGIHLLGLASHVEGDYPTAMAHYEESLQIRREIGDRGTAVVLGQLLGVAAHRAGDHLRALAHYTETLQETRDLGLRYHSYNLLAAMSALAADHAQPERALWLASAAARRSEMAGVLPIPLIEALRIEGLEQARGSVTEEAYRAAWARGAKMSEDEAIAEALALAELLSDERTRPRAQTGVSAPPPGNPPPALALHHLTPREIEVLRLMAAGRTSKEIAAELVIAVPTVDRHITHIYAKIGARRRTDATTYALKHELI